MTTNSADLQVTQQILLMTILHHPTRAIQYSPICLGSDASNTARGLDRSPTVDILDSGCRHSKPMRLDTGSCSGRI